MSTRQDAWSTGVGGRALVSSPAAQASNTRAPPGTGLTASAELAPLLPHPPQRGNHAQTQSSFSDNLFLAHGLPAALCREPGLRAVDKHPGPTPSTLQRAHTS